MEGTMVKTFNHGTRIEEDSGDYVLLQDCGPEGMVVHSYWETLSGAIDKQNEVDYAATVILKIVRAQVSEVPEIEGAT